MEIYLNGQIVKTKAVFLADFLTEQGFVSDWLATAVNSELVAADARQAYKLARNDKVEVLSPMQGG